MKYADDEAAKAAEALDEWEKGRLALVQRPITSEDVARMIGLRGAPSHIIADNLSWLIHPPAPPPGWKEIDGKWVGPDS